MKILAEIYDFVTGGSLAAPVGLACAVLLALLGAGRVAPPVLAGAFLLVLAGTLAASTAERAR